MKMKKNEEAETNEAKRGDIKVRVLFLQHTRGTAVSAYVNNT
jgi:hypothetical protein